MKNSRYVLIAVLAVVLVVSGCDLGDQESKDRDVVASQQSHYAKVQPLPFYDYSIPRDIVSQIYNVVTQESRSTFTVIETITGTTKFSGPSLGYGIPADTSLTNPMQPTGMSIETGVTSIEQAEPNGLFSSKNTDGTWVLFIDGNGDVAPVYTEHKISTWPFVVKKTDSGEWVRADAKKASMTVKIKGRD